MEINYEMTEREKDELGRHLVYEFLNLNTDCYWECRGTDDQFDPVDMYLSAWTANFVLSAYTTEIKVRDYSVVEFNDAILEYSKYKSLREHVRKGENVRYIMYWKPDDILMIFNVNDMYEGKYPIEKRRMRHDNNGQRRVLKDVIMLPFNDAVIIKGNRHKNN